MQLERILLWLVVSKDEIDDTENQAVFMADFMARAYIVSAQKSSDVASKERIHSGRETPSRGGAEA